MKARSSAPASPEGAFSAEKAGFLHGAQAVGLSLALTGVAAQGQAHRDYTGVAVGPTVVSDGERVYALTKGGGYYEKWVDVTEPARAMKRFLGRALSKGESEEPWRLGSDGPVTVASMPSVLMPEFVRGMESHYENPAQAIAWRVVRSFRDLAASRVQVDRMIRIDDPIEEVDRLIPHIDGAEEGRGRAVLPESHQGIPLAFDEKHECSLVSAVRRRGGWAAVPSVLKSPLLEALWSAHLKYEDKPYRALVEIEGLGWFSDAMQMKERDCRDFCSMIQISRTMVLDSLSDRQRLCFENGAPTATGLAILMWIYRKNASASLDEAVNAAESRLVRSGDDDVVTWILGFHRKISN